MTLEQFKANLEAIRQQMLRLDGMAQLLTEMITQTEAAAKVAAAEVKD